MSERHAVQNPMLKYADEIGWEFISASEAMEKRSDETGLYFADVLKAQLIKLNRAYWTNPIARILCDSWVCSNRG